MSTMQAVHEGLRFLCEIQRSDGEMPSEADVAPSALPAGRTPGYNLFISTFVYDALERFIFSDDPERLRAKQVQEGILRFLREQQEVNGTWRFLGRGSHMDSDADTTSCVAAVVLDKSNRAELVAGLKRFKDDLGLYPSYVNDQGKRYSWILSSGLTVSGYDRVVQANVARFLGKVGESCRPIWEFLEREITGTSLANGSPDYPSPITFLFMTARAYGDDRRIDSLALKIRSALREWFSSAPSVTEAPLSHAIAAFSWLRLRGDITAVKDNINRLVLAQRADGGWPAETFFVGGYRSRALTTAVAVNLLDQSC